VLPLRILCVSATLRASLASWVAALPRCGDGQKIMKEKITSVSPVFFALLTLPL
jgi:hypothetical protein